MGTDLPSRNSFLKTSQTAGGGTVVKADPVETSSVILPFIAPMAALLSVYHIVLMPTPTRFGRFCHRVKLVVGVRCKSLPAWWLVSADENCKQTFLETIPEEGARLSCECDQRILHLGFSVLLSPVIAVAAMAFRPRAFVGSALCLREPNCDLMMFPSVVGDLARDAARPKQPETEKSLRGRPGNGGLNQLPIG